MSQAVVEARGLTWIPDGARAPVLAGVDLRVEPGDRVLLVGPSGSGKSTLLRAIAGVLHVGVGGEQLGELLVGGRPAVETAVNVGLLLQDPRNARVAETVGRDVAFGCENVAMPRPAIATAVADALAAVRLPYGVGHDSSALSGGEAQRLALAGVIAARPDVLLLDEPTSMLDPESAAAVREAVLAAVRGTDCALVVVEHRLHGWADVLDRVVVLGPQGSVVADGATGPTLAAQADELAEAGVWVPGRPDPRPLPVPTWLVAGDTARGAPGDPLVEASRLSVTHRPALRFTGARRPTEPPRAALADVDATALAGRVLALRGPSGAGKSWLVSALCGLVRPSAGRVEACESLRAGLPAQPHRWRSRQLAARVGWVPQNATASVVGATVRDCLLATVRALRDPRRPPGALSASDAERADSLAELLGLAPLLERNPYRLSGGESRRLAVACGLLHGPSLVCLDEPTVGQDRRTWAAVAGLVLAARAGGAGVVVSTHDDALAALADDSLQLAAGRVVA